MLTYPPSLPPSLTLPSIHPSPFPASPFSLSLPLHPSTHYSLSLPPPLPLQVAYVVHDPEYPAPQDILDMADKEMAFTQNYLKENGGIQDNLMLFHCYDNCIGITSCNISIMSS